MKKNNSLGILLILAALLIIGYSAMTYKAAIVTTIDTTYFGDGSREDKTIFTYKDGSTATVEGIAQPAMAIIPVSGECYGYLGHHIVTAKQIHVNPGSYSSSSVLQAVNNAVAEWNSHASRTIFGAAIIDTSARERNDGVNAISFGSISDSSVIAHSVTTYISQTGELVDYDVTFNSQYYTFTDCTANDCAGKMDMENTLTHEMGHSAGLNDQKEGKCSAATMYAYCSYGYTGGRTLEAPDITGLEKLYGSSCTVGADCNRTEGGIFCQGSNIYQSFEQFKYASDCSCSVHSTEEELVQTCNLGCSDGSCLSPVCNNDSSCNNGETIENCPGDCKTADGIENELWFKVALLGIGILTFRWILSPAKK